MPPQILCEPITLHYLHSVPEKCNPELSPIIFLHGCFANLTSWNKVMPRISNSTQREAYAIDLRNHGRSEWSNDFSLDILIADIENFMNQRNIKQAVFVGHSLGGRIALYLALRNPQVVTKIVVEDMMLSNPTHKMKMHFLKIVKSVKNINLLPRGLSERQASSMLARHVQVTAPEFSQKEVEMLFLLLTKDKNGRFQFEFNIEAVEKGAQDESLYAIDLNTCKPFNGPALFIYGARSLTEVGKDTLIPKYFLNCQLREIDCNNHILHNDFTDVFAEKVSDFING